MTDGIFTNKSEAFTSEASKAYNKKFDKECSVYYIELSKGMSIIS